MDISESINGTDYLMLGSNLYVKSVIDIGSTEKCCLARYRPVSLAPMFWALTVRNFGLLVLVVLCCIGAV